MNKIKIQITRAIINFAIFSTTLISTVYYSYNNIPELFLAKNILLPFKGALLIAFFLALIFAILNEVVSMALIKKMIRE